MSLMLAAARSRGLLTSTSFRFATPADAPMTALLPTPGAAESIFCSVCQSLDKFGTPLPFEGGGLTHRIVDDVLD
jgi:hypothetical protein